LPRTTVDDLAIPLIRICFYDRLIAYDHRNETFWLIALELPGDIESPTRKMDRLEQLLNASVDLHAPARPAVDIEHVDLSAARSNMTRQEYLRCIERTQRYIRNGDIYQVNFSQRFDRPFTGRPIDLFAWQNHYNPSPYAVYLDAGDFQVVSASPEMFVSIGERHIRTKPIKGTRRRFCNGDGDSEERNTRNLRDLLDSSKEQAELNMIVDLERNDIARICEPGSRRVVQPRTIETYPTVFHAVATVGGQLRPEVGLVEVLKATFPGGSITGAPKIRAMEIIDELEPTDRSVYTGSIGFIGLDGTVCLNIAIRTVIITGRRAFVQTGGGIVADSDPEAEWEETITKARALLAGIDAVQKS
jgi:para-aminobenzoate synthetase component I